MVPASSSYLHLLLNWRVLSVFWRLFFKLLPGVTGTNITPAVSESFLFLPLFGGFSTGGSVSLEFLLFLNQLFLPQTFFHVQNYLVCSASLFLYLIFTLHLKLSDTSSQNTKYAISIKKEDCPTFITPTFITSDIHHP